MLLELSFESLFVNLYTPLTSSLLFNDPEADLFVEVLGGIKALKTGAPKTFQSPLNSRCVKTLQ
jgi:hypothetical protein